jgi:hypothetical protein
MDDLKTIKAPPSFSNEKELAVLLREGLNSGEGIEMTPQAWVSLRAELSTRRKGSKAS